MPAESSADLLCPVWSDSHHHFPWVSLVLTIISQTLLIGNIYESRRVKEANTWFSSLFSHEHNDPFLPSTTHRYNEKDVFRHKSLSLHPLLIFPFREHVFSLAFLNSSFLRLSINNSPYISCQLNTVSKPIFVQVSCFNLSQFCICVSRVWMKYELE